MSGRKLGGGRVLGSGKGLVPPQTAASAHAVQRAMSSYAPSDSTLSLGGVSGTSASPQPSSPVLMGGLVQDQDLASNVSLGRGGPSKGGAGDAKLVCPICEEEMLTLLQLNRHIDDNHQELPDFQQDEVKTWFDKQVLKAKRFQPLSLINQKLKGLEVFESNETPLPPVPVNTASKATAFPDLPVDPDDLITHSHWQRQGPNDRCTEPACGRGLGVVNGSINCRKCGRLFCEEHTMYQMKLSRSAAHEPVRGYWVRVCETCYKSREGYNDHNGHERDHTAAFTAMRRKRVERQTLEISRLEKRLTKLTQLLADPPPDVVVNGSGGGAGSLLSLAGQNFKNQRKAIEQSVVTWEDDAAVAKCPFCHQDFGSWTFRRHHCRICGRVVCADPQTGCSSEVGLNIANPTAATAIPSSEKPGDVSRDSISVDIRMCRDCKFTIFAKRDFMESIVHKPPDQRAYETLRQFQRGITQLLPSFQRALLPLQDEDAPPSHAQIQEASKLRKRLTDSFTKYDIAAKRIRDMKTTNPAQQKLQKAIYQAASSFLHMHMLPLKNLPHMLKKHPSSSSASGSRRLFLPNGHPGASPLRQNSDLETMSTASETSTVVSALETEEKDLRERLVVLEEQKHMVQAMIASSQGQKRFEEVGALTRNVEELNGEIERIRREVVGVEERWEGLYANGGAGVL
ncbi:FYVE zinc finger-domain-containing protein [Pseudomassariella vexata]|uniref:FYVE zinc finger-domain-containing protein n=1 Tax=Pseudomassariella vexata TaxID=1141098 RepID=A0A1Y2EFY2_9PEZI|nr:FYVE zinc finger-domain-containing protein [Pseudomassariella vexata]ORY70483.1 FYVE zinc finger-domain-containing protein [Pseudomassariella vexata]